LIKPPIPHDETQRLQVLHSLRILDTEPEERFDRITRLACKLFNVPIALVSLVDQDRQWFKSSVGLDAAQTPREISFCGHAIIGSDVFVVAEAQQDQRFCDNPLVAGDPGIRFYAGYPLRSPGGQRIGTLCIIDRQPRNFSDEDAGTLKELGQMIEGELFSVTLATTDELTGISNRRGFNAIGNHALMLCRRLDRSAMLVQFDLDGFKAINDNLGHDAGDRALADFARILLKTFRDSDVVGRLGGDEFGVLMAAAEPVGLGRALERLQKAVDERNAAVGCAYPLCFSAGATVFDPEVHRDITDLLRDADQEVYAHKRERKRLATGR
jgi:diguanylate cyclase (GGDEF)-like protein